MAWRNNKVFVYLFITLPVALVVIGACTLSAAAVVENLRFIGTTNQILGLVRTVRSIITEQKGFAQNPGEDVWADLAQMGQISPSTPHTNSWKGDLRATTASTGALRIETDLPTHDCRRLALYFLDQQPNDLGVVGIEAQAVNVTLWSIIYPTPAAQHSKAVDTACGRMPYARLALIFKVR